MIWTYIIGGLFALLGVWTFLRGIKSVYVGAVNTANDLANTLKDATEIARAYREDLSVLRQIAQSGVRVETGDEPESIIPKQPPATMPPPYWNRYPVKPDEPDAPPESAREVDQTPTDEEIIEQERNEAAVNFEASERQKAATRNADQARIKEMLEASGKPEGQ